MLRWALHFAASPVVSASPSW